MRANTLRASIVSSPSIGVSVATLAALPLPAARLAATHIRWCRDRHVSYRAWDNSHQPDDGPRRQCWSPYS
jgi:hypothetical protein